MRTCISAAVACILLGLPAMATAASGPDLQARSVTSPSRQEAPGSRLVVGATVRNVGNRTAGPSRVGFYLSRDRRKGRGDHRLRPRPLVRTRRARTFARLVRTLRVPRGVPTGNFALLACADDTRRVRERRERNNCRSASRRIRIVVGTTPILPPTTTFPPPGTTFVNPFISVTGPPNGSVTFDTTPNYTGTARSPSAVITRIEARVDAGPFSTAGVNCAGCGTLMAGWAFAPPPLANGAHTISFRAFDAFSRASPTLTRTIVVDTTPPIFSSITAVAGSASVAATFTEAPACITVNSFDFTATINGAPVAVNNVSCTPGSGTLTLTLASAPPAGTTVSVAYPGVGDRVISDQAGNVVPGATRSDAT